VTRPLKSPAEMDRTMRRLNDALGTELRITRHSAYGGDITSDAAQDLEALKRLLGDSELKILFRGIRLCSCGACFLGGPLSSICLACRATSRWRSRPKKYDWTPERDTLLRRRYDVRVKGRSITIAAELGWPKWVIVKRARELGLSRTKEAVWTDEQKQFLRENMGRRTTHWLFLHLPAPRRTETAIINELRRLKLRRRSVRAGFHLGQLEQLLGADHKMIETWAKAGFIRVETRGYRTSRDTWCVSPDAVLEFLRKHRDLYDLRRVDQETFLSIVFGDHVAIAASKTKQQERAERRKAAA